MKFSLLDLPEDLLIIICSQVEPQDLLSLKQTCRAFLSMASQDYVWHNVTMQIPLQLHGGVHWNKLSGPDIQRLYVSAARLEHNWNASEPSIRRLLCLKHEHLPFRMQFVSDQWFIALYRSPQCTHLSLWFIGQSEASEGCRRYFHLNVPGATNFSATTMGTNCLVAIFGFRSNQSGYVDVYRMPLSTGVDPIDLAPNTPSLCFHFETQMNQGTFSQVHMRGHILALALARFENGSPYASYKLMFINVRTGNQLTVDSGLPENFDLKNVFLYPAVPRFITLLGMDYSEASCASIHVHSLPVSISDDCQFRLLEQVSLKAETGTLGARVAHYKLTMPAPRFYLHVASDVECSPVRNAISVIFFRDGIPRPGGVAVRIPLPTVAAQAGTIDAVIDTSARAPQSNITIRPFRLQPFVNGDIVAVGLSNRRAVWLERNWDADTYRLVRASFSDAKCALIQPIVPPHLSLPFEPHTCYSLTFDEASGRVAMGIHTGQIYILQF
ncbi:hypothetical protein FISHEDRAFT_77911 [Fistulina hepatica ATCC 64428]|nr:hypothetical protein FISHEDRAFT_77911 [Fistulina hepatica ATCC 64428]